jgi:uncharacterized protein (TIGR04168 family)
VTSPLSIALVGDLHGHWDAEDVAYFNASTYDLLLFTGDIGSGTSRNGVALARQIARLDKRALVVAGNNDAPFVNEIAAEFRLQGGLSELMRLAPGHPLARQHQGNVVLCGYSMHPLVIGQRSISIIVGRPFAMGGNELSFPDLLEQRHGISSLAQSEERLCALVDQAPSDDVIFLAHNGPSGLGEEASAIWGCDFRPQAGDWGDRDLLAAVSRAKSRGKRVLAVVAGHMHRSDTFSRTQALSRQGVLFVNPAYVPRIFDADEGPVRHHMKLELGADAVTAHDVFVR